MDLKILKEFIDLARNEGLSELKYETTDIKIALAFPVVSSKSFNQNTQVSHVDNANDKPANGPLREVAVSNLHTIKSPFVGTYYSSAAPGKPTFVKVGDKIKKGQVICILEAMKIMNEIESDISGEVVEILLENESLVEFAQPLFRLRV